MPGRRFEICPREGVNSDLERDEPATAPETLADAISRLADFLNETETLAPAPGTLDDATALEELRRSEFNLVFY